MCAHFMAIGQTALSLEGPVDDVATDVEERGLLVLLLKEVVVGVVRAVGAVVERETPRLRLGALGREMSIRRVPTSN
jgi:hypothetical protein